MTRLRKAAGSRDSLMTVILHKTKKNSTDKH